jgi:hypothetical protein
VTKGRVELPRLLRLDVLSVACLPVPPLGHVCRFALCKARPPTDEPIPESALWESNPPGWFGRPVPSPLGQGHMRKERELNPQGSSLGRFQDGCHRQLACPSVQAAASTWIPIERTPVGQEGVEPTPYRLKGGYAAITPRPQTRRGRIGFSGYRKAMFLSPELVRGGINKKAGHLATPGLEKAPAMRMRALQAQWIHGQRSRLAGATEMSFPF